MSSFRQSTVNGRLSDMHELLNDELFAAKSVLQIPQLSYR